MWSQSEKDKALDMIQLSWDSILATARQYELEQLVEVKVLDQAYAELMQTAKQLGTKNDKIIRQVTLDTHGYSDKIVQSIFDQGLQNIVDKQNKSIRGKRKWKSN